MEKDTKKLFQITEAAHACGLSRSTLMRMEKKGLLTPAYIAAESGRRYYDSHDVARILQIEKFKSMGFTTEQIADYFAQGGIDAAGDVREPSAGHPTQRRRVATADDGGAGYLRADHAAACCDLPDAGVYGAYGCR